MHYTAASVAARGTNQSSGIWSAAGWPRFHTAAATAASSRAALASPGVCRAVGGGGGAQAGGSAGKRGRGCSPARGTAGGFLPLCELAEGSHHSGPPNHCAASVNCCDRIKIISLAHIPLNFSALNIFSIINEDKRKNTTFEF